MTKRYALTYGTMNCLRAAKNAHDCGITRHPGSAFAGNAQRLRAAGLVVPLPTGGFAITPAGIALHAQLPQTKAQRAEAARAARIEGAKI